MLRDVCKGQSGLNQIIHESMLHVVGQAQYGEGVLQGVVRFDPVCIDGVFGINLGCFRTKQLSQQGRRGRTG